MTTISTDVILFDLDGTLVNSTLAVENSWTNQVNLHNQSHPSSPISLPELLHVTHGTRTIDTFKKFFPELKTDPDSIEAWEREIVTNFGHLGHPIPGSSEFLQALNQAGLSDRWGIVTSGTTELAYAWYDKLFGTAGVERPGVFVTANDVGRGKPDPEGYLTAFGKIRDGLGREDKCEAIVFEDAPTGVKSGVNGGFLVVGIGSTFSKEVLVNAGAKYVVEDFTKVKLERSKNGRIILKLDIM
ncbi:DOG2 [[Candida] subhashii]|uniref:DOG2 n=1 Tax=[Candida] subhashii TaxID=561895 RepID=A0A8J5QWQ6_9ASCO|nr:DOG2 [[Candida] subhashii]KAG7666127.1 DOG2 [[Candida] subhashii]